MVVMRAFTAGKSLPYPFLFAVASLQIFSGLAKDDPSGTKHESKEVSHGASRTVFDIILICLGMVTVIAFCVFLLKLWQKKKREEQHAQLLKLFEDDDELEVELGMRD
ncbi:uncharacterized protein LOC133312001 [Gastrolobium bilobum]|uniref:uncharacterized protein LOC133312001 n=1 Tax=Gastrolobium bilobum TaxID=150636 RepID=UPI002AAFB8E6|nr:uncharacterized protein LOC133312001 [Gastrolobium bilobum]